MKKTHNFRKLEIWKRPMILVKNIYGTTSTLPESEKFGLISQLNRCAVSVPSNIAEGSGRSSNKDFVRFLRTAISSSYEIETQLLLCQDLFDTEIDDLIKDLKK